MNLKDYITEKQLQGLLKILPIHNEVMNKVPLDKLGFMKRQLILKHKSFVNNLYEELKNV